MKLYMVPDGVTLVNYRFNVKNEQGEDLYTIASVSENLVRYKWRMWDMDQKEILVLDQQKALTFSAINFDVFVDGKKTMEVLQKNKFTKYVYTIPQADLTADGDFISHNFKITKNKTEVAHILRKLLSWGDSYEVEISDPELMPAVMAMVIAVECSEINSRRRRRR